MSSLSDLGTQGANRLLSAREVGMCLELQDVLRGDLQRGPAWEVEGEGIGRLVRAW